MKQIIWKELREWYKWGIGFGLLWFLTSLTIETKIYEYSQPVIFFFKDTTLTLHCIAVAAAATLGYLQFYREKSFDQRAFLLHRPMCHSKVFWGKFLAGFIIYLVTVSAFLLRSIIERYYPAQPYPFEWTMLIPGILILLNGIPAYFAGTLIANRHSSWFGSRLLPVVLVFINCVVIIEGRGRFGTFLMISMFIAIIYATYALEVFKSFNGHSIRFGLGQCAGSITLGAANTFLCVLVLFLLALVYETRRASNDLEQERFAYHLFQDGKIYKTRYVNNTPVDAVGLDSIPYSKEDHEPSNPPNLLNDIARVQWVYLGGRMDSLPPIQSSKRFFDLMYSDETSLVYYVKPERRMLLFERTSKKLLGSYGPQGWHKGAFTSAPGFPENTKFMGWKNIMSRSTRTDRGVFVSEEGLSLVEVETNQQHDKTITLLPLTDEPIRGTIQANIPFRPVTDNQPSSLASTILTTDQEVVMVTHEGNILARLDLTNMEDNSHVLVSQLDDLKQVVFFITHGGSSITPTLPDQAPTQVVTFDMTTGKQVDEISLPAIEGNPIQSQQPAINASYGFVTPPIVLAGLNLSLGRNSTQDLTTQYLLLLLGASLTATLIGIVLSRKLQLTKVETILWMPANLLLSWAGPLTMLSLNKWPARTHCPTCNRQRSIHKDQCEHCEASFPEPELNGTEIFEAPWVVRR